MATPVRWEEIAAGAEGDERALRFEPPEVLARLRTEGDLLAPARRCAGKLPRR